MADMTFAEHVNIVANLDNSLSMSASLNRSGVALKVGSTYDVVSVLSVHNRTTKQTEHTTISGTIASDTIGAYLSLLESTIEAAYPIAVTTSTTSTVSQVATLNSIGVELTLSGSEHYIRALNMKVSLTGVQQYDIDAELVNPLELTPSMLLFTPEALSQVSDIAADAQASADAADASELLAEKWASEAADTVVLNGKYSSYHWATKASENVAPALTHAARTDNPHAVTAAQVGLGNVSNIAQVTAVSGTAPIVSSGGTTPVISISAATTSAPGSMSAADKTKLDGIATNANNYVLPISVVHDNDSGALHATDALRVSGTTLSLYKGDSTFESVTTQDTIYTHPTTDGSLHVPATGTTNSGKVLTAGATAGSLSWATPAVTDLTVTAGTTAGPTINSSTGADVVIPSASGTNSGVVTTGAQTFAGVKTMTSPVLVTPSIGVATGTSFNSITGLATVAPVAPAVTAAVGTSTLTARQDHVHPTNFTATATDIKMNGTQAVGTLLTFPRADHVHPTDTSRAAAATSVQKDSNTGVAYLPAGTTAQRPTLASNIQAIRYNTDLLSFEGWSGTAWGSLGGGATNRRNYLINGNFDSWQYGTSQTSSGYGSDDRWNNVNVGSTKTHSRIYMTDTERALFNATYFSRTVTTSVVGASNFINKQQLIENVTLLAGKTVTLSFWAKADSNKNIALHLKQNFGTGGSPSAEINAIELQLIALTTTWQKKTITVTIPSIVGKTLGTDGAHTSYTNVIFTLDAGSSATAGILGQQSGTFDIAQVKLEDGSVATDGWHPYDGEFGGEVQACKRYYQKLGFLYGYAFDANNIQGQTSLLGTMRALPNYGLTTTTPYAESPINVTARNGVASTVSSVISSHGFGSSFLRISGFSGMTAGTNAGLLGNQIYASAEL